jgi:hypothetical protein
MENKTDCGKDPLLSYIGMDNLYKNGKLMYIAGKEDAAAGDVGTLDGPVQAQGVDIDPVNDGDVVLFSYVYTKGDGSTYLRQLMVKLNTFAGAAARFSVLVPSADCCGGSEWVTRTADLTLVDGDKTNVVNPHGLAQDGNYLYLVDYQNTKIFIADAEALEAAADNAAVPVSSLDISEYLDPPPANDGRGQAVIILGDYLYALFHDSDAYGTTYGLYSYLLRLLLDHSGGIPKYETLTLVGINAQSIIPVIQNVSNADVVYLLIPAIGGPQDYNGGANGINSNICYVEAQGAWLKQGQSPAQSPALVKITGDPAVKPATAYDIHAAAAAMRDGSSAIFILTQLYDNGSQTALWRIYQTTVEDFFALPDNTPLSKANLTVVDEGTITSLSYCGLYFWDMLYEQVPDTADASGDRVWVGKGTPILVTRAAAYGSPTGTSQNPYAEFGYIGGVNVNAGAFDLLIETLNQAKRQVSLKRNFVKTQAPKPAEEAAPEDQAKGK